ncbi:MAG TPA: hypothetical protein VIW64_16130 [Pyrinomonadaceae bacterium]|jgi:hypothetical protein
MVEFKPLFTGILEPGRHEVYTCAPSKRATVLIVRLKNKTSDAVEISMAGNWDGETDVDQLPDGYRIMAGQVAEYLNFSLMFDGGGSLVVNVADGGLIHCYVGGIERSK